LVWKQVGLNHLFISPSSNKQINQTAKGKPMEGNWHTEPVEGAVAVWAVFRNGKRQKNGHFSTVVDIYEHDGKVHFDTVDGNSNSDGSREGKEVAYRNHIMRTEIWSKTEGQRLLGFVYPSSQKGNVLIGLTDEK
jgi:hypothetical protein